MSNFESYYLDRCEFQIFFTERKKGYESILTFIIDDATTKTVFWTRWLSLIFSGDYLSSNISFECNKLTNNHASWKFLMKKAVACHMEPTFSVVPWNSTGMWLSKGFNEINKLIFKLTSDSSVCFLHPVSYIFLLYRLVVLCFYV